MKRQLFTPIAFAFFLSLTLVPSADAQLLWRWFGPKSTDKTPPPKSMTDARRLTEVNIEISWLADPVTFPYYLEAHATPKHLEVRGYVPNKAVREHALKIAQVYSSVPVVDSMKEHPSLLVRPGQISPHQLQSSAQSSLRVALPKQAQQLKVEVANDGKVVVLGQVNSFDEKVAVSQSLRRLHGATSVQNLTSVPGELAAQTAGNAEPRDKTPIVKTSSSPPEKNDKPVGPQEKSRPWTWPFGKGPQSTKDEPPLVDTKKPGTISETKKDNGGPTLFPDDKNPVKPKEVAKIDPPKATPLTVAELQKRIKAACPMVRSVEVEFTSKTEVRILVEIRDEKELSPVAERIFALPELEAYRPDLQFKIGTP